MKNIPAWPEVKPKPNLARLTLGNFDYKRTAREMGGLIPAEEIGEIFAATKNNPALVDYILRHLVKNPDRVVIHYRGTVCHLPDYHPFLPKIPLYVSRVSGFVLSKSWGRYGEGGLRNGIFDAAALILGLEGKKDFPAVYRRVRAIYEEYKQAVEICAVSPKEAEAMQREINVARLRQRKERLLPYLPATRKTVGAQSLWRALPLEVKEEEFGGSFYGFSDFLKYLAGEDPTEGPFRVERIRNGHRDSKFRLTVIPEKHSPDS